MVTVVVDANEQTLSQGSRVRLVGTEDDFGVVLSISDPDGDVNDYGRPVAINPSVTVRFDKDGVEDSFVSQSRAQWYDDPPNYICDDVVLVTEEAVR